MDSMISLTYSQIPSYLQKGTLYQNLDANDSGEIHFTPDTFRWTDEVSNVEEIPVLLNTLLFWGVDVLPKNLIKFYIINYGVSGEAFDHVHLNENCRSLVQDLEAVCLDRRNENGIIKAISLNRLEIVKVLVEAISIFSSSLTCGATNTAAAQGKESMLLLLHENGFPWDYSTFNAAIHGGHLACMKVLYGNGCAFDESSLLFAARAGCLECFAYALSIGIPFYHKVCAMAAGHGHLDILSYAYTHSSTWDEEVTRLAAKGGHAHCLQYALQRGCPVSMDACELACKGGYLDCLRLLFSYGANLTADAAHEAAAVGSTVCLAFLHENGCPWTGETTTCAAYGGHAETLRYAIDNGCPYEENIVYTAAMARRNSIPCLKYLIEEQNLYMEEDGSVFGAAFRRCDLECVAYLIGVGCPYLNYEFESFSLKTTKQRTFTSNTVLLTRRFDLDDRDVDGEDPISDTQALQTIMYAVNSGWDSNNVLYTEVYLCGFEQCRQFLKANVVSVFDFELLQAGLKRRHWYLSRSCTLMPPDTDQWHGSYSDITLTTDEFDSVRRFS